MDAWRLVLCNRLCYFWSWSKGNRKISTRQPYTMDHYTVKRFYKKRHWKDKQICEGIRLFSSYFSDSGKVSIVGNSAPAVDPQQVFKGTFKALINEDYSIGMDIERYQGMLEHALSKVNFSVGTGIFMLPSNLNWNNGRTKGYNNKIFVSKADMKIGSNRDIIRDHKKLISPDVPNTVIPAARHAARHDPVGITVPHNLKMLTEKHNDGKLAITLLLVGTGLIAYHFW